MRKTIAFHTLGCKVNQYETQLLAEAFRRQGFDVVDGSVGADVYVINSCTVTGIADRKSRNYARRSKRLNPCAITALIGCYAEVAREYLSEMPEIDILLGSHEKETLPAVVASMMEEGAAVAEDGIGTARGPRTAGIRAIADAPPAGDASAASVTGLDARTRAYIKVEDGCDRHCAYCVIPRARGAARSRPARAIVAEAEALLRNGYREIVLTGVNAALYGRDFADCGDGIIDIVNQISDLGGDFRIRLSSLEPTVIDAAYAERLIRCERLCPHLHLPLQSGSDAVLNAMGRGYDMEDYLRIIDVLRSSDDDFGVTTDMIVGFPGETDADFARSVEAVEAVGFAGVHVFRYSRRAGTAAAGMDGQVPADVKRDRAARLALAGEEGAAVFRAKNRGKIRRALFLGREGADLYVGVTDNGLSVRVRGDADPANTFLDVAVD
ncbi:MAG: tRNA (N(6)-L-threonylcarbamoyladenosine(37)-C(2))-methylthiotransferase MtaB [Clostridiales Family XIII bacterium]|jgi:threonylcarbamoyladenosine tRNA methylthiotransferase MtaB|nr:tRNA (N(6)-L-threonylcarbamoyladenosine(37)-C(2))-methylthiotransferase MtaB [Clostridiales Family XIII bacterium]